MYYTGYHGYGAMSVAEYTQLIQGISKMVQSTGARSVRLPQASAVRTLEEAEGILDLFRMRAEEMGWIITDAKIEETGRGEFFVLVWFTVPPGAGPEYVPPPWAEPKPKEGVGVGGVLLGLGIGVAAIGGLIYLGRSHR